MTDINARSEAYTPQDDFDVPANPGSVLSQLPFQHYHALATDDLLFAARVQTPGSRPRPLTVYVYLDIDPVYVELRYRHEMVRRLKSVDQRRCYVLSQHCVFCVFLTT